MSGTIAKQGGHFKITFKYNPKILEDVKALPDRKYDYQEKNWLVPLAHKANVDKFAYRWNFQFTEEQEIEENFSIPALPELKVHIPLKKEMFPYQKNGVAYNLEKKRTLIGDKPGLGKTVQSIATVLAANQFPCLIICPSSLKINWQREWHMWTDKKAIVLTDAIKNTFPNYWEHGMADVFIVNYESLKKYFVQSIPTIEKGKRLNLRDIKFKLKPVTMLKSIIVDESHRCKSFAAKQTKFVKGISAGKEMVLLCSGTPVINKPLDLLPQLMILNQEGNFGGYKGYLNRYCAGPNAASNLKELNYKLNLYCFYQRDKADVLKDLPAKMRQKVICEITNRKEYEDAENDLRKYLLEYKQASDEKIQRAMRGQAMVMMGILKNISARGKLEDVFDFVNDIMESGEKLVLFAHLKEVIQHLKDKFPKSVSVTGGDDMKSRQESVDKFQKDKECQLIICSIKAAGVGLTLTASSRVAFIELPWTAADTEQCEDRCHRIGQKDSVQATYFLGTNTIDEYIYDIIEGKRNIAAQITGTEELVEESVIDNLIDLFSIKS